MTEFIVFVLNRSSAPQHLPALLLPSLPLPFPSFVSKYSATASQALVGKHQLIPYGASKQ